MYASHLFPTTCSNEQSEIHVHAHRGLPTAQTSWPTHRKNSLHGTGTSVCVDLLYNVVACSVSGVSSCRHTALGGHVPPAPLQLVVSHAFNKTNLVTTHSWESLFMFLRTKPGLFRLVPPRLGAEFIVGVAHLAAREASYRDNHDCTPPDLMPYLLVTPTARRNAAALSNCP